MDRLGGAIDILEILGVDAGKDDADKVALGVFEAPGKDYGLSVVDPVNGRDRCRQLPVPPIARLPKEIAAGDIETCSLPTGRRDDELPLPIGTRDAENLRQAGKVIRQRFLKFIAADGGLKVGRRINVVPLRRLLDLEQHGVDRLE